MNRTDRPYREREARADTRMRPAVTPQKGGVTPTAEDGRDKNK